MNRARALAVAAHVVCAVAGGAAAQPPVIQAVRATGANGVPHVDGRLTDVVWRDAPVVTGFTQKEPNEGEPAPEQTEVHFVYDDDALYVAARMASRNAAAIRALVTRRDREGSSEQITISLDTYRDRRTAYSFSVNAAGVRIDWYHSSDSEGDRETSWNPVWEAATRIDDRGWSAEMRIPFSQLRFSPGDEQEWGVNVVRKVPERNEVSYWVLIRRTEPGWSSRMGTLTGIRGIRPSHRVELLPYIAGNTRARAEHDPADPFSHRYDNAARAGGDLKVGLGPNLTLDATFNPDFAQVESDPAVVNLSAYEVFFDERRPFFLEGSDLLDRHSLFYSRRIGAPPPGRPSADFAERRANSTILGAGKLAGRLPSGLSIATLAAVSDRETVRTFDSTATPQFGRVEVAPRTLYAAASARQEFGEDASTLHALVTAVRRDLPAGTSLADLLPRSAYSGFLDGRLRWAGGSYDANAYVGFSSVQGDSAAILQQQRSSRRWFQRPDADHVEADPRRRTLGGAIAGFNHSKLAGRHWLWDVDLWQESPGFEPNDLGAKGAVDSRAASARLRWRETQPSRWYRRYEFNVAAENSWNYGGLDRGGVVEANFSTTLPNFWRLNGDYGYQWRALSDRLTRGGPAMGTLAAAGGSMELEGRANARNGWSVDVGYSRDESGGWEQNVDLSVNLRPGDRWELSVNPEWQRSSDTRQFIGTEPNGRPETYFTRYMFATVDLSEVNASLRLNYTFTPNLSLETYAQPFAASGRYRQFGELALPRHRELHVYGTAGSTIVTNSDGSHTVTADGQTFDIDNEDFNERSLRTNVVLRWEWRLGSTLYLVWQQDRSADRAIATARPGDLMDAFRTRGDNFLAVKVSYWLAPR